MQVETLGQAEATVAGVEPLDHYFYVSAASGLFDVEALSALLAQSRRDNARLGLSGMLLYQDGSFIQYLEGPATPLAATMKRILDDPRHSGVIQLTAGPADQRLFGDWSMGFADAALTAQRPGGFDLTWSNLGERLPPDFPLIVRTMMTQVYGAAEAVR